MISIGSARNGEKTARYRGALLHSAYNPGREADRFVRTVEKRRCYVVLGGGLGHLATALASLRPDSLICTVHPDPVLREAAADTPGAHLSVQSEEELESGLAAAFGNELRYGFELLSWEPARRADASWFSRQEEQLLAIARRNHHSLLTTGYFGFRWTLNSFRNSLRFRNSRGWSPPSDRRPVLVAPGPSLERVIPWLRQERSRSYLVALSSAYGTLLHYGLTPDLLLHSDGGYWAARHLGDPPTEPGGAPPLASTIRAAIPANFHPRRSLFLTDPTSPVETALGALFTAPLLPIRGHGTVAGTALRLLQGLFPDPPVLVGVDLASRGYVGHSRPHTFDPLLLSRIDRLAPLPGVLRRRLGRIRRSYPGWEQTATQQIYAGSLSSELAGRGDSPKRIYPSPVSLPCSEQDPSAPLPPPSATRRDMELIPGEAPVVEPEKLLARWQEALKEWSPSEAVGIGRSESGNVPLLEELAQLLALPELLRLRRGWEQEGEVEGAFAELVTAIERSLERISERVAV